MAPVSREMTADEYAKAITKLGMNSEQASAWLGFNPKHGYRYLNGVSAIPSPVAILLRLMLRKHLKPEQV